MCMRADTQLAAAQRMNTDVRRAVFVAIMGSDDCMEAFEKLMRLPIKVCALSPRPFDPAKLR